MDANSKLDFGVEWQEIFNVLQSGTSYVEKLLEHSYRLLLTDILCFSSSECGIDFSEDFLREKFESIDEDGSGELDEEEMRALFDSLGRPVSKRVIANIMRLSDTDGNGMFFFPK